jgi:Protein of unknown function (DUF3040)
VPLSEEEQKMLEEIERNFYDHDPALAKSVRTAMVTEAPSRSGVLGVAGLVGGLVLVIFGLSRQVAISYLGFLAMVAGVLSLEPQLRRLLHSGASALTTRLTESQPHGPHRRITQTPPDRRRRTDNKTDKPDSPA